MAEPQIGLQEYQDALEQPETAVQQGGGGRALAIAGIAVVAILTSAYLLGRLAGDDPPPERQLAVQVNATTAAPPPVAAPPLALPAASAPAPVRSLVDLRPITGPGRPPLPAEKGGPYGSRVTTSTPEVALTFDDGPDPDWTPGVLGLLRKYNVKATFCVIGVNVVEFPNLVRAIVAEGHTLCNHSWSHDMYLGTRPVEYIRADLMRTNDAIRRAAGPDTKISYYRQPGGAWTASVVGVARQLGMTPLHWAVDPMDWRKPGAGAIAYTVEGATRPGLIVLMHDGGGNRWGTVTALGPILSNLTTRFRLVALPPGVDPPPPRYVGSLPREWR